MDSVSETTESFTANAAQILRRLLDSETRLRVSPACREYNNAALRSRPRLKARNVVALKDGAGEHPEPQLLFRIADSGSHVTGLQATKKQVSTSSTVDCTFAV
jgi:hypothetical protein